MCAKVKAITPARRSTQQQQQQSRRSGRPSNNGNKKRLTSSSLRHYSNINSSGFVSGDGDDSEGSENGNDSGSTEPGSNESLDFLTAGPSQRNTQHQTRQDNTADDPSADESEVSNEPEISMPPPRPQVARRSAPPGSAKKTKAPRKQTQPKKRKDHVLREIVTMQHSVAHLIPRAPFYRYGFSN